MVVVVVVVAEVVFKANEVVHVVDVDEDADEVVDASVVEVVFAAEVVADVDVNVVIVVGVGAGGGKVVMFT